MIDVKDKEKCCGCFVCEAVCPVSAIFRESDEYGNAFPVVNQDICIRCDQCSKVCPIENQSGFKRPIATYAAVYKNREECMKSSSGGAFYAIAKLFMKEYHGKVYGCTFREDLIPAHAGADIVDEIAQFRGSKYIRSEIPLPVFKEIHSLLKQGRYVLFSGTPCQCDAVRRFVGENQKLYTCELICHGVIDQDYWKDYLLLLEKKERGSIVNFSFRCKDAGQTFTGKYRVRRKEKEVNRYFTPALSYYYSHFLSGSVFRENCYKCKYAQEQRCSDITIGDYWGYTGHLDSSKGISVVLVNTDQGRMLLELAREELEIELSSFGDAARNNEQLLKPFDIRKKNYSILETWRQYGAQTLEKEHLRRHWKAAIWNIFAGHRSRGV